jgi:hypothetical protein
MAGSGGACSNRKRRRLLDRPVKPDDDKENPSLFENRIRLLVMAGLVPAIPIRDAVLT